MSGFDVRAVDLNALNSLTKYPSIPTYHRLDPGNGNLTSKAVSFPGVVVGTEKVDGCLPYTARISMADGTRKVIGKVKAGEEVLGGDEAGKVVATPVLETFNHGKARSWMRIKGERWGAGRGFAGFSVVCTPNHRFWMADAGDYVAAEDLAVGQRVTLLRSELDLTPCQSSVLLGKLLGDGYLHITPSGSGSVVWGHREADRDYVEWTSRALGGLASGSIRTRVSGYGTTMLVARTTFHPCITDKFSSMVSGGKKAVPEWVAAALDPLALAFWYMDDGSLQTFAGQEDRATFATNDFAADDCKILIRALERLGVRAELMTDGRGYLTIRLNSDAAERLFLLVAPYVPPAMQRKLPPRYRGHQGWLPPAGQVYKPPLVPQRITDIEYDVSGIVGYRRDISTGTQNFFANGVLVHNSNARIIVVPDGTYLLGSREELLYAQGDLIGNPALGIVANLRGLAETLAGTSDGRIKVYYLELYGGKIGGQAKQYSTRGAVGWRLFDVAVVDDWDERLGRPLQRISAWREGGGQRWLAEEQLGAVGLELAPRLFTVDSAELPTDIEGMHAFLGEHLPRTLVALDETGQGAPEGIVLRSTDRAVIAKARFQDYVRTLKRKVR